MIVHGIEESKDMESMDRVGDDKGKITSILQEIDYGYAVVKQVIRLGQRQDGADAKDRPINLMLETENAKENVLLGEKNLGNKKKEGLDKVFIQQNWTPKEREARRIVVKKLMDRKAKFKRI